MDRSDIESQVREFAAEVTEKKGLELVHVEISGFGKKASVRVFIDKQGGINHDDCSAVSQDLEKRLDAVDLIPGRYILEVSSPGIERGLYSTDDFRKFAGEQAKIRTHSPMNGQRNFRGRIEAIENGDVVFDDRTSGKVNIPLSSISKANLEYDIERELKRSKKRGS
ncbi:MAG: ribosome maturation factor RimP [Acidobacteria bacterium]|nr:MAG: ribosome maturation factor RimP [Acidobacteriota bacterium]REK01857.1 MAG: ribosome maturation factor RimP [Acidobacteriota bacterium]REK14813.1 MAG: ribosome maturation factor RimP [Acidobacteriota bacterium]REK45528.1 MAG: ribosome maturation factor RimP [Acidobacteriota bacterium]